MKTEKAYLIAKEQYAKIGVDTDAVLERLQKTVISMHCWQGDDVNGFLFKDIELSGGIQTTGNYPGKANTPDELRADIEKAMSLIPGKQKLNLHAIYADTDEKVELDQLEPKHFERWVEWAKKLGIGLDFNPTCFSHPMADTGYTISSADENIRNFWIRHCKASRKIAAYFGKELGQTCVTNHWFPDGSKDTPIDKEGPRARMMSALDEVFSVEYDEKYTKDALESKVFGIGAESYTVGSNEFALGYAVSRGKMYCLDAGHFHPTEVISDKIPAVLLFTDKLLLHVSRPVRWDSDHVVILDDELQKIMAELCRHDFFNKVYIGLDFFDASINRIAAWVIGIRNTQKAALMGMLEPTKTLFEAEHSGDYTKRLAMLEELKSMPWGEVWDEFCRRADICVGMSWIDEVKKYERDVLLKR